MSLQTKVSTAIKHIIVKNCSFIIDSRHKLVGKERKLALNLKKSKQLVPAVSALKALGNLMLAFLKIYSSSVINHFMDEAFPAPPHEKRILFANELGKRLQTSQCWCDVVNN